MSSKIKDILEKYGIVAEDEGMLAVYRNVMNASLFDRPVLILGESGAGKDVLAKFIHDTSRRADKPFVHINCTAIPDALFESELFGYQSGSFTGAHAQGKKGLLEQADGGTIFLDEIGELSLVNQVKLLDITKIKRIGSNQEKTLDIRLISGTNIQLEQAVYDGKFRRDLYYRIQGNKFFLPPLRERPKDIRALTEYFSHIFSEETHQEKHFTEEAIAVMQAQPWAGNVRELRNVIEKIYALESDTYITGKLLEENYFHIEPVVLSESELYEESSSEPMTLRSAVMAFERDYIKEAIDSTDSLVEAAKVLGINLSTLNRKKRAYGLYKHR